MNVTKEWVNEHGEGHWLVSNGIYSEYCDDSELSETMARLSHDAH